MGDETNKGDAAAIIETVERLQGAETLDFTFPEEGTMPLLIVPSGKETINLKPLFDQYRSHPERKSGTATLTTIDSFIAHVNRFKDDESAVYLDDTHATAPMLMAVLDYHQKGAGHARFGEHRGVYHFPLSAEWKAWMSKGGAEMSQAEFAVFLEDRIPDILAPTSVGERTREFAQSAGITFAPPARLLELSRGLSIKVDTQVAHHVNLSTGESQLTFKEEHTSEGEASSLKVPSGFAIQVPVVKNGPAYQIPVRLRYRVSSDQSRRVLWKFALYRTDLIFEEMVVEAGKRVADETELPVFRGKPEGG